LIPPRIDEIVLRRYVLGQLGADERIRVEDAYFEDDETFGVLLGVEDELIEQYIANRLTADERELLEREYLSTPGGRERLRLARALVMAAANDERAAPAMTRDLHVRTHGSWSLGRRLSWAATVFLAVASAWLLTQYGRSRREVASLSASLQQVQLEASKTRELLDAERARAELAQKIQDGAAQAGASTPNAEAQGMIAVSLMPRLRSDSEVPSVVVPRGATAVVLKLGVGASEDPGPFRVSVERESGDVLMRLDVLTPASPGPEPIVTVPVPAQLLAAGRYEVKLEVLSGARPPELLHSYPFRVAR
jgi:hypothetical protein